MIPLAQFYLPTLSIDMLAIGETKLITLFMSEDYPEVMQVADCKNQIYLEFIIQTAYLYSISVLMGNREKDNW